MLQKVSAAGPVPQHPVALCDNKMERWALVGDKDKRGRLLKKVFWGLCVHPSNRGV